MITPAPTYNNGSGAQPPRQRRTIANAIRFSNEPGVDKEILLRARVHNEPLVRIGKGSRHLPNTRAEKREHYQ